MTKMIPVPENEFDFLELQTTLNEIKIFLSSSLYQDYLNELDLNIQELSARLDDPNLEYSGRDYDKFRGAKEMAKRMKNFFTDMLSTLDEKQINKEQSNV